MISSFDSRDTYFARVIARPPYHFERVLLEGCTGLRVRTT